MRKYKITLFVKSTIKDLKEWFEKQELSIVFIEQGFLFSELRDSTSDLLKSWEEEADFMNKVAPKMNMYYFFNFMEEDLEKDFDNVEDLMNKIKEKPTFSEQCNVYDWYKHA